MHPRVIDLVALGVGIPDSKGFDSDRAAGDADVDRILRLQDLEDALGLPGGNIFPAPLSWPFVSDAASLDTPAERWGVDSGEPGIFFCGSTARRGGAVSGIGGHNAAMAVLESL